MNNQTTVQKRPCKECGKLTQFVDACCKTCRSGAAIGVKGSVLLELKESLRQAKGDFVADALQTGNAPDMYRALYSGGSDSDIENLLAGILASGDVGIMNSVVYHGWDNGTMVAGIAASDDPRMMYNTAKLTEDEDEIAALMVGIVKSGDAEYMLDAATRFPNHQEQLVDGLISSGDAEYMVLAFKYISGADQKRLAGGIVKSGNSKELAALIICSESKGMREGLVKALIITKSGNDIGRAAAIIEEPYREVLYDGLVASGDTYAMVNFAEDIDDQRIVDVLARGVSATGTINEKERMIKLLEEQVN